MIKSLVGWILRRVYRVQVTGLDHFSSAGKRVLIVANHTSFLDPVLLWAFLPAEVTFAINTQIAEKWWVKATRQLVQTFPMDPTQAMSVKAMTGYLKQDRKAVVFPEGRITVTGSLMKIYDGAGLIADKADAMVLPIRIDGAQYTPFSKLRGIVRLRWFPRISLNVLPPRKLAVPEELRGETRRLRLGMQLEDIMTAMVFVSGQHRQTLFSALLDTRKIHGGRREVLEDMQRKPWCYDELLLRTVALGEKLAGITNSRESVGVMLPNSTSTVATILGLQYAGRVPAMLNFGAGVRNMIAACEAAGLRCVISSKRFIEMAELGAEVAQLGEQVHFVYLEDLAAAMTTGDKLRAWLNCWRVRHLGVPPGDPDETAVILFTSGSEGVPKGVVLSHINLLSNCAQIAAKIDFNGQDKILNVLPMFHSFGLTAGTLLPLVSGMRAFLYPSPLHYRVIPEIAYDTNATILFGTNTFLAGYGKSAHPYDFFSIRYVVAGAERLQEETRRQWSHKFGIRILEGYGVTETSPVLAVNTPMHFQAGTVGRLLPGIEYRLEPVPGVEAGGRLHVSGPNIMRGYLKEGQLNPTESVFGLGWHDTGDLAEVDEDGFVTIKGRVKRFAKIGGEMISLQAVEELANRIWPDALHAAMSIPDPKKGEQIVLVTEHAEAARPHMTEHVRLAGLSDLHLPREIHIIEKIPVLATGKLNYPAIAELLLNLRF